ncbi:hypothetical protein IHQ52_18935 [Gordonia amicalis]|uniref:hypothetical protein n=1 Tax=Gordonia amicalis TaxID=89053 RepID=UPI001EDE76B3|nr:hypothetical protein [Gordonia amicalis]UKO91055.1 hypothetical protein IHQ52_18935 [Gordonia amicalis]
MTDDEFITEADHILQRRIDAQHDADLDLIESGAAAARQLLADLERHRDEQPDKLAEMRSQADTERDWTRIHEPWSSTLGAIPSYRTDGETAELHGILSMPSIAAKEIWGCRLAFDVASSDRPANDIVQDYFGDIRDTDHLMLVFAAAIDTLADHVIKPMLQVVEERGGDYEMRTRLADAARNAWATRIGKVSE